MKDYYFTFGQEHRQKKGKEIGLLMKDFWVRVTADSADKAKQIFIKDFTSKFMESPDDWVFQYNENHLDKRWFPKGECSHLRQKTR